MNDPSQPNLTLTEHAPDDLVEEVLVRLAAMLNSFNKLNHFVVFSRDKDDTPTHHR